LPLSNSDRARACMARRRRRARAEGLCGSCCKRRPEVGRLTCSLCCAAAARRVVERRAKKREMAELRDVVGTVERAGDRVYEHHLYADAAEWYERALQLDGVAQPDRLRITAKLRRCYSRGRNPSAAVPLDGWLTKAHSTNEDKERIVESLIKAAQPLSISLQREAALSNLEHAAVLARSLGLPELYMVAALQRIEILHVLDRDDQARLLWETIDAPNAQSDAALRYAYYKSKMIRHALLGEADVMRRAYRLALDAATERSDNELVGAHLSYAFVAWQLGDIEAARHCVEAAILAARERQIPWLLSYLYTYRAAIFSTMGQYETARGCLIGALGYESHAPLLDVTFSWIGIPLALKLGDATLLAQCDHTQSIATAFRGGNPTEIGCVAAAFGHLYASKGDGRRAKRLLHRALTHVRRMEWNWDLLLAVAQYGARSDIPVARRHFERRLSLPTNELACACLSLFDAFVARRDGRTSEALDHAKNAVRQFETLCWLGYAETARGMCDEPRSSHRALSPMNQLLRNMSPALTAREQQVAELALKGMTNRAIAKALGLSENTVEKYMGAVLTRLGIRSRHQLAAILTTEPVMHS
jgi:DNA-binding CsgD family transcriptional regulator